MENNGFDFYELIKMIEVGVRNKESIHVRIEAKDYSFYSYFNLVNAEVAADNILLDGGNVYNSIEISQIQRVNRHQDTDAFGPGFSIITGCGDAVIYLSFPDQGRDSLDNNE